MWNSINKLTSSIAQQAAELAQEVGLDEQLVSTEYFYTLPNYLQQCAWSRSLINCLNYQILQAQAKNLASNVIKMDAVSKFYTIQ